MKLVGIRFRRGVRRKIKDTQKIYKYLCPIDDIKVGDWVVVDVKLTTQEDFRVGRIEEIEAISNEKMCKLEIKSFVICKLPVKDFDKRCQFVKNMKYKLSAKYERYNAKRKFKE
jgi:hypothetical protein